MTLSALTCLVRANLRYSAHLIPQLADNIFGYVLHLWENHTSAFFQRVQNQVPLLNAVGVSVFSLCCRQSTPPIQSVCEVVHSHVFRIPLDRTNTCTGF